MATHHVTVTLGSGATPILTPSAGQSSKNVLAEIPAPGTSPVTRPGWTIGDPTKPAAFDAATFWILPAVSGEGVRVTAVR